MLSCEERLQTFTFVEIQSHPGATLNTWLGWQFITMFERGWTWLDNQTPPLRSSSRQHTARDKFCLYLLDLEAYLDCTISMTFPDTQQKMDGRGMLTIENRGEVRHALSLNPTLPPQKEEILSQDNHCQSLTFRYSMEYWQTPSDDAIQVVPRSELLGCLSASLWETIRNDLRTKEYLPNPMAPSENCVLNWETGFLRAL